MEVILGLYLVGFFISLGVAIEFKEKKQSWFDFLLVALIFSSLSWINIGTVIGEYCNNQVKKESETKSESNG